VGKQKDVCPPYMAELTGIDWQYLKVLQSSFEQLQPTDFQELMIGLYV